jgi:hypothetical protein
MRVLVACEYSGVVRDAFIRRGHDAISCDLRPSERPGPHIQDDVRSVLTDGWDLIIGHPPCTYLSKASGKLLWCESREQHQLDAMSLFLSIFLRGCAGVRGKSSRSNREAVQGCGSVHTSVRVRSSYD